MYDNENRGSDGRALCVYRAWPIGRPDLKATVSEASKLMRGKPAMYVVVRLDKPNGPSAESVDHVLTALMP